LYLLVESAQHLGGITAKQRIAAQHAAQPTHHISGTKAAPNHISDHNAQPAGGKGENVIPIAADSAILRGHVASRQLKARHHRQPRWQQAALKHNRSGAIDLSAPGLGRQSDSVGHDLKQIDVVVGEPTGGECPDVKNTDNRPTDQQRDPE
jgi:hypothetical protein